MHYWLATSGKSKTGPLTLEELAAHEELTAETLVWRPGLSTWKPAADIPEIAALMGMAQRVPTVDISDSTTHIRTQIPENKPRPERPRTYLGWSIAALILCCSIPAIVAIVYGLMVSTKYDHADYEQASKNSEYAEIWLLVSVVFGLVTLPFTLLIKLVS